MDCPECREKLNKYLDGELTAGEAEEVEEHISRCDRCRREMEELRRTIKAVQNLSRHRAPPEIADEVTERVQSTRGESRVMKLWMPAGLAAAAAVLVAVFVLPHAMNGGVKRAPETTPEWEDTGERVPDVVDSASKEAASGDGKVSGKREEQMVVLHTKDPGALREHIQEALRDRVVESAKDGGAAEDEASREVVLRVPHGEQGAIIRHLRSLAEPKKLKPEAAEAASARALEESESTPQERKETTRDGEKNATSAHRRFDAAAGPGEKKSRASEEMTYIRVRIVREDSGSDAEEK